MGELKALRGTDQTRRWVVALFALAAILRVGWVVVQYPPSESASLQYPDEEAYWGVARSLAAGQGLVDEFGYRATYMPAYPAFLAVFAGLMQPLLWGRIVQSLLGACVAPATFLLTRKWVGLLRPDSSSRLAKETASRPAAPPNLDRATLAAVLAGLAAAFDPFLIFFSGLLLTESLFAVAMVLAWVFFVSICRPGQRVRGGSVLGVGLMLLVCVMLRPSAIILVIAAPLLLMAIRRLDRTSIASAVATTAIVLAGLTPWAARNHTTIGQWRWLTTRGGISLYDGLREGATGASDLAHTKAIPELAGLGEIEWDRYFRTKARESAASDPLRVIRLGGRKFLRTWNPVPNVEAYRSGSAAAVSAIWMVAILLLAAVGWWRCRRRVRAWAILLLPVVAFTLLHMVFVGSVRYRVVLMPMVMVLSGTGLAWLIGGMKNSAHRLGDEDGER